jgi:putative ATP-dependent endonuclease of the OLD family
MKVKRLSIKNVLSYQAWTDFKFEDTLNIVIGPNGGGKTNLQRILALVLSKYFIHQYEFQRNDQEAKILQVDPWTQRVLQRNLQRFNGDGSDQIIEIEIAPERADIANIQTIGNNLDKFNEQLAYWESPISSYPPAAFVRQIEASTSLIYRITNLNLESPAEHTAEWAFAEYLRSFFIFMRLTGKDSSTKLSSPVFFFFSERNAGRSLDIGAGNLTEQHHYQGFRSAYQSAIGDNTNLMQWGAQYFARLHRRAVGRAATRRDATTNDFFEEEADVKLLSRYMQQLGYRCDFLTNEDSAAYTFALKKGSEWVTADKFSSGEREIVHFLLAMFALNAKDGLVLVDEPELHLHPRWQQIFLHLFRDLASERNNQFIISTHSPVFVSPDTINTITRIHRKDRHGSTKVALRDVALPEKKSLVRMINSQNNERIFFADKVVLVEGITDRLVFSSLIERAAAKFSNHQAIEVVEVGGKHNFGDYSALLDALATDSYVIADLDYLSLKGAAATKALFVRSDEKLASLLLDDKKSLDRRTIVDELERACHSSDVAGLRTILSYVSGRQIRLKSPLSAEELAQLEENIASLKRARCHVLRYGEVEDYLPNGVRELRDIVAMTVDPNWVNHIGDEQKRVEVAQLLSLVLGLDESDSQKLERQMRRAEVNFPSAPI